MPKTCWQPCLESSHLSPPGDFFFPPTLIKWWHLREKIRRAVCSKSEPLGWCAAFLKVNILSYQEWPHQFQLQRSEPGTTTEKKYESEFNIFNLISSQYDLRGGTTTEKVKQFSSELSKSRVEVLTRQNTKERDAHKDPIWVVIRNRLLC